jgi:hypothetical protein
LNFLNFLNFHQPKLLPWNCKPIPLLPRHENKTKEMISSYFQIFSDIFKYFQIFSDIFRYFQIFSNIFRYFSLIFEYIWLYLHYYVINSNKKIVKLNSKLIF